ncbi:MAG: formylglycine-generating enzyme family protein [Pseudomonadota bacterium]
MKLVLLGVFIAVLFTLLFLNLPSHKHSETSLALAQGECDVTIGSQVWVEGGTFVMGSADFYPDEGPVHEVTVDGFWIDTHEVTNAQFAKFVEDTGYVTVAERVPDPELLEGAPPEMFKPGSVTFTPPLKKGGYITSWWSYTPGANWKHPSGPESTIEDKDHFPVVQIAFEDAQAYADWTGRELPTEAQYEFAARNNLDQAKYGWEGDQLAPKGQHRANTWQGFFPVNNTEEDGYRLIAPVACYQPNDYGAYDLIGNVWEWTTNWYAAKHNPNDKSNPKGPASYVATDPSKENFPERVIKGGSYLCAPNYCVRYRPPARHAQDIGLGAEHIGFRTVAKPS